MGLFSKKDNKAVEDQIVTGGKPPAALETYKVVYKGGHPDLPKSKSGEIRLLLTPEFFQLEPTIGSKSYWKPLILPYADVITVTVESRQVSTFEGVLGGLDSKQLNQDNNLHFSYVDGGGNTVVLRMEMLSGLTVMGQAKKCREFEDRLRNLGIYAKFRSAVEPDGQSEASDIPAQIAKLAALRGSGVLTEAEFETKKTELLGRL